MSDVCCQAMRIYCISFWNGTICILSLSFSMSQSPFELGKPQIWLFTNPTKNKSEGCCNFKLFQSWEDHPLTPCTILFKWSLILLIHARCQPIDCCSKMLYGDSAAVNKPPFVPLLYRDGWGWDTKSSSGKVVHPKINYWSLEGDLAQTRDIIVYL